MLVGVDGWGPDQLQIKGSAGGVSVITDLRVVRGGRGKANVIADLSVDAVGGGLGPE